MEPFLFYVVSRAYAVKMVAFLVDPQELDCVQRFHEMQPATVVFC